MENSVKAIKERYTDEISLDKPIVLNISNDNIIKLYGISMKDYYSFVLYSEVLNIDKNSINDPKIIQMQYMDFLIYIITSQQNDDERKYVYISLYNILSFAMRKEKITLDIIKNDNQKLCFSIDGVPINKSDFDLIRKAILVQNIPNYSDEYIDPTLKKDLQKAQEMRNKGHKQVDIEHKITFLSLVQGLNLDEIYKMPIRKFMIMLEMESKYTSYKIAKTAEMSGMVTFKQEIPHYMDNVEEVIGIDYNSFKGKINGN